MNFVKIEFLYDPDQHVTPSIFEGMYSTWLTEYWPLIDIAQFLRIRTINAKSKWKCKFCQVKILEPIQIQTSESHVPVYHVKCYMALHRACIEKINQHEAQVQNNINLMQLQLDCTTKKATRDGRAGNTLA